MDTDAFCFKISKISGRQPRIRPNGRVSLPLLGYVPIRHQGNVLRGCARYTQDITGIGVKVHFGQLKIDEDDVECLKMFYSDTRDDQEILNFIVGFITKNQKNTQTCRLVHLDKRGRRRSSGSWPHAFIFNNYLFHYTDKERTRTLKRLSKRHGCLGFKTIITKKNAKLVALGQYAGLCAGEKLLEPEDSIQHLFQTIFKKRLLNAADLFRKLWHYENTGCIKPIKQIPHIRNTVPPAWTSFAEWLQLQPSI